MREQTNDKTIKCCQLLYCSVKVWFRLRGGGGSINKPTVIKQTYVSETTCFSTLAETLQGTGILLQDIPLQETILHNWICIV